MKAWTTTATGGVLELADRAVPRPAPDEVLVRIEACGVCRTDLHVVDQEIPVHRFGVVPGHEAVGIVTGCGDDVRNLRPGDRVGTAWLRRTCGACRWCREGKENLCPGSLYSGWDTDGGYAEFVTVPEAFAYLLPSECAAAEVAPLLCAGIIGFRALTRANLPPGGRLGVYGFGSSAHITSQIAMAAGAEVYAMTRGAANRELAHSLGCVFVGDALSAPPVPLDSAIVFAPVGELVPIALKAAARGGTVVLAGIHMSEIPSMKYQESLFNERDLRTVTSNTRADGAALLRLARTLRIVPKVTRYPFMRAGDAVSDLRAGTVSGSLVITVD